MRTDAGAPGSRAGSTAVDVEDGARGHSVLAGIVLVLLFAFIVMRVLQRALEERDAFSALALAGLISVFGLQAIINMAVNLSLMPAKGMTLPFISYGGSSLLSMAFAMGLVLVFGRRRPRTELSSPVAGGQLS